MAIAVVNMMMDHVVDILTTEMIDDVLSADPTDETAVSVLRGGKLQDDPTKDNGLNVLVYSPQEEMPVEIYTSQRGLKSPVYQIGGGIFYMYPFKLRFFLHFKGESDRDAARTKAQIVGARAKRALMRMEMPVHPNTGQSTDDFDETIIEVQVDKYYINEGGGKGHFIWRGSLDFFFLTEQIARDY